MQSINVENDSSSNEEENNIEIQNEKASLKQKKTNKNDTINYPYRKKKKINNKISCIKTASFIIISLVLSFLFIIIFIQLSLNYQKDRINLKKVNNNNSSIKEIIELNVPKNEEIQKIKGREIETEKNISIIEDIKNVDIKPLGDAIKSMSDEILEQNSTKKKIGIAFIYSTLSANGIGRFITVTAKYHSISMLFVIFHYIGFHSAFLGIWR